MVQAVACDRGANGNELREAHVESPQELPPSEEGAIRGTNYVISVPILELSRGAQAELHLTVAPTAGFKVNVLYPWHLEMTPTAGVSIERLEWDRESAATFSEESVVFDIPISGTTAGTQTISGHLRFSICNDSRCDLHRETVSWEVSVQ